MTSTASASASAPESSTQAQTTSVSSSVSVGNSSANGSVIGGTNASFVSSSPVTVVTSTSTASTSSSPTPSKGAPTTQGPSPTTPAVASTPTVGSTSKGGSNDTHTGTTANNSSSISTTTPKVNATALKNSSSTPSVVPLTTTSAVPSTVSPTSSTSRNSTVGSSVSGVSNETVTTGSDTHSSSEFSGMGPLSSTSFPTSSDSVGNYSSSVTPTSITETTTSPKRKHFNINGLMKEQICSQERSYKKDHLCDQKNSTIHCIFNTSNSTYGNNTREAFEAICNENKDLLFGIKEEDGSSGDFDYTDTEPVLISDIYLSGKPIVDKIEMSSNTFNTSRKCFCESDGNNHTNTDVDCRCYPSLMSEFLKKQKSQGNTKTKRSSGCSYNLIYDKKCNITEDVNGKRNATCIIPGGSYKPFDEVNCNDTSIETLLKSTMKNSIHELLSEKQKNCLFESLKKCPLVCTNTYDVSKCHDVCESVCTELCQTKQAVQDNYRVVVDEFKKLNSTKESLNGTSLSSFEDLKNITLTNTTIHPFNRSRREIEQFIFDQFGAENNTLGMIMSKQIGEKHTSKQNDDLFGLLRDTPILPGLVVVVLVLIIVGGLTCGFKRKHKNKKLKQKMIA